HRPAQAFAEGDYPAHREQADQAQHEDAEPRRPVARMQEGGLELWLERGRSHRGILPDSGEQVCCARMRLLYTCLLYLLTPLVLLRLLWKSLELPGYRQRIAERFGFVPRAGGGIEVWVHAVSVGESVAALPLIKSLIERHG